MIRWLRSLVRPVAPEKRTLLRARWEELPPELRTDWQVVGRQIVHCGYTLGPAYCSLGCTHCYLPNNANRLPIPAFEEMKEQIDANRALIGPGSVLQITGGDVVDAYWRAGRAAELVEIVRYADGRGVVPMLMTHGQILLDEPGFLEQLIVRGRLRKLAVHIDITQAGRPGFPLRELRDESDLHPLREAFVERILAARRATGIRLSAAQTITVTQRNIGSIDRILRWLIAEPRRLDAFHMISFQTEADVGRTRFSETPVTPVEVWRRVEAGVGVELTRDNIWFGHPDCSNMTVLALLYPERRPIDLIAGDPETRAFWGRLLSVFGGVGSRGSRPVEETARRLALAIRHPSIVRDALRFSRALLGRHGLSAVDLLRRWRRGQLRFLIVVAHNFMGRGELAEPRSELASKRLEACAFRGAVRKNGGWVAVPMCTMNAEQREPLYASRIREAISTRPEGEDDALLQIQTPPDSVRRRRDSGALPGTVD